MYYLQINSVKKVNLYNFLDTDNLEKNVATAEMYLVKIFWAKSLSKNFDHLRYSFYHHGKISTIGNLPPSSASIKLHILRAFFITYTQIHCINRDFKTLDPIMFGYDIKERYLIPKVLTENIYPPIDELVPSCNYKKCSRKSCLCVKHSLSCISFCACKKNNTCENKFKNN